MKKYLFLMALIAMQPAFAETDQEKTEYCKQKFQQISLDSAFEDLGCKYQPDIQKAINQNMVKTVSKCQAILAAEERAKYAKIAANKAQALVKAHGLKAACDANGNLYPAQLKQ